MISFFLAFHINFMDSSPRQEIPDIELIPAVPRLPVPRAAPGPAPAPQPAGTGGSPPFPSPNIPPDPAVPPEGPSHKGAPSPAARDAWGEGKGQRGPPHVRQGPPPGPQTPVWDESKVLGEPELPHNPAHPTLEGMPSHPTGSPLMQGVGAHCKPTPSSRDGAFPAPMGAPWPP